MSRMLTTALAGLVPLLVITLCFPPSARAGGTTVYAYDKFEVTRTYVYDLASAVTASQTITGYDELGRQTLVRNLADAEGQPGNTDDITLYVYDVVGNLSKLVRKGPDNNDADTVYDYDRLGRQLTATDPAGGKTVFEYDDSGNTTKQKVLSSGTDYIITTTDYDTLNRVTKTTDAEGHYRETWYDSLSRRYKEVAKSSGGTALSRQRFFYDNASRHTKIVAFYDAAGTSTTGSASTDRVTLLDYNDGGRVTKQTSYNMESDQGLVSDYDYDDHGRLTKTADPASIERWTWYDESGRVTARRVSDIIGNQYFKLKYDEFNRLTEQIAQGEDDETPSDDLETTYDYDPFDRQTKVTDPEGQESEFVYDDLGRQITREEDAGGIGRITESAYDRLGRLITLTAYDNDDQVEQHTIYFYDLANHRTMIEYPDDDTVDYEFDLAGRMTKRTDQRNVVVEYDYDDRGLLTKKNAGDPEENLEYDGLGRMILAKKGVSGDDDDISKTAFEYDDLSRVTLETQELFEEGTADQRELEYDYDQAGNRLTAKLFHGLKWWESLYLAYEYDELSQNTLVKTAFCCTLSEYLDMVHYEYAGRHLTQRSLKTLYRTETTYPGPTPDVFLKYVPEYDQHRRITRVINKTFYDGTDLDELARYDYTYDDAGNRLSKQGHRGTGSNAEGFSKIQKIPAYEYDGLHRLTYANYDFGGGTQKSEDFDYDHLGNRVTYWDHRNDITTAYANNKVNEYTGIGDPGSEVDVYYDAAGNLSRDENDYEYSYDYDDRLTKVTYDGGTGSTQVAHFEYDALGRLISSQLRFDADENAMTETLKYYYDGSNVIAEYDESDDLSRRYIHGTTHTDERAVMLVGYQRPFTQDEPVDTYYYLLQELGTVAGLMSKNGTLVEAYEYDAYGKVSPWGYQVMDFDRDGDVVFGGNDYDEFMDAWPSSPASDPMADGDMDGDVDCPPGENDWDIFWDAAMYGPEEPVLLYTSSVGNPYFFTGRRLHFLEILHDDPDPEDPEPNWQVQYNRARHYHPSHGRWLQRDPAGYLDGLNSYEYVDSSPLRYVDPNGLRLSVYQASYLTSIRARETLVSDRALYNNYKYYRLTGLNRALEQMISAWDVTDFVERSRVIWPQYARATTVPGGRWRNSSVATVYMTWAEAGWSNTVFHEFVHVLQLKARGAWRTPARDEGEAWGSQVQRMRLSLLGTLEQELKPDGDCNRIRTRWTLAWSRLAGFPGVIGWAHNDGTVQAIDIRTAGFLTGFRVRCEQLAAAYNHSLRSLGFDKAPCCLKLVCRRPQRRSEAGPDHVLNPVWR